MVRLTLHRADSTMLFTEIFVERMFRLDALKIGTHSVEDPALLFGPCREILGGILR
jgi:hypothetical protein